MKRSFGRVHLTYLATILVLSLVLLPPTVTATEYAYTTISVPSSDYTWATGINDSGSIVGRYYAEGDHGFLYEGGSFTEVKVPGSSGTIAWGINNSGDIVGVYGDAQGLGHGFLKVGNVYTSFDVPGATFTEALGINNSGSITGLYIDAMGNHHGFLKVGNTFTTVDVSGTYTDAWKINDSGSFVGRTGTPNHGYVYAAGSYNVFDVPPNNYTWAYGINNSGSIVGLYVDGPVDRGFLKEGSTFTPLDVPGNGGITSAYDINNYGSIVGWYRGPAGDRAFLATPVPENSPPVALCQNVTVAAGSTCTTPASIDNGSFDPDDDPITLSQSPSEPYPLGNTPVTLTVTDSTGASSQCTGTVTLVDNTPPTRPVTWVNPAVLWPPNGKMVDVTLNYNATDNCGQPACQISSVTSNEAISSADYAIMDAHHVKLRAERLGSGNGRIYTVTITCRDASDNSSDQAVMVTVPHDQGKKK
jgi:hypothetical protein